MYDILQGGGGSRDNVILSEAKDLNKLFFARRSAMYDMRAVPSGHCLRLSLAKGTRLLLAVVEIAHYAKKLIIFGKTFSFSMARKGVRDFKQSLRQYPDGAA